MPRYYFDIQINDQLARDEIGLEFESEKEVRDAAIGSLPEIAAEELPDGGQHSFWVKVRDQAGDYIFAASLELKSGWLKKPGT